MSYHNPVLLKETVDGLAIQPDGIYVDVTYGGGGHSKEILSRLSDKGKLFAFDQDPDALANVVDDPRLILIPENFRYISRFLRFYKVTKVDGILADFGVSSHQFDEASRGFSTRTEGVLDMRMNQRSELSAREVVNNYSEEDLASVLYQYGDLKNSRHIARVIVNSRSSQPIDTTEELKKVLKPFLKGFRDQKFLAQLYQAIRIEVNGELQVIKEFLLQVPDLLTEGGRLSVLSYHSLEDRLVKRFIQNGKFEGEAEKDVFGRVSVPLKKVGKLIVPSEKEIAENNRARSAKLRIAARNKYEN
ncbi:MAG: 16S rRNA (cytosine(1402)-N(4))-methyltransferase RsmH [Flavobacteriaceae bacterium]|nr:16S rRNA (cytosine(1402)-N(4))-methyltransferase RsmH [Flavobacteriaceae bacterium]NVJ72336.1 16S rRNA (cytosine(1402)-N(4))-methyltransferase RsmH [Flavobacteriaceae bacterium]